MSPGRRSAPALGTLPSTVPSGCRSRRSGRGSCRTRADAPAARPGRRPRRGRAPAGTSSLPRESVRVTVSPGSTRAPPPGSALDDRALGHVGVVDRVGVGHRQLGGLQRPRPRRRRLAPSTEGRWCSAPRRTSTRRRRWRGDQQGEHQQDRAALGAPRPRRPAATGPGAAASGGRGAFAARACRAGRRGTSRRGRTRGQDRRVLAHARGAPVPAPPGGRPGRPGPRSPGWCRCRRSRCRRAAPRGARSCGQLGVVADAGGERVAHPVQLVQQDRGVGRALAYGRGRWPGRPARRRTPAARAPASDGGGTSWCTCL